MKIANKVPRRSSIMPIVPLLRNRVGMKKQGSKHYGISSQLPWDLTKICVSSSETLPHTQLRPWNFFWLSDSHWPAAVKLVLWPALKRMCAGMKNRHTWLIWLVLDTMNVKKKMAFSRVLTYGIRQYLQNEKNARNSTVWCKHWTLVNHGRC